MRRFVPLEGENIIVQESIHWKNYILPGLLTLVSFVSLVFRSYFMDVSLINRIVGEGVVPPGMQKYLSFIEVLFLGFLTVEGAVALVRISFVRYYITSKRIVSTSGILRRNISEMFLDKCEMIYLNQSIYERLFRTGDILVVSAGAHLFLDDVYDALRFKQVVLVEIEKRKNSI